MFHGRYLAFVVLLKLSIFIGCCVNNPVDVQSLSTKLLELENEILRLKATVCGRDQEMREMAMLRESSQQNEAAIADIRTEMSELTRQTKKPVVAFRSFLTLTICSIPLGQTIVFDRVDLNVGNAYNRFNGVFTAPFNGTYSFSMALGNPNGSPGTMFMVQSNGTTRTVIEYVFAGHTTGWDMGGMSTVTVLTAGDSVWVEGDRCASGLSGERLHTGFSGLLVN